MSRKAVTLEVAPEFEDLLRGYAEFLGEMKDAVVERGREHQRRLLERAVDARVEAADCLLDVLGPVE